MAGEAPAACVLRLPYFGSSSAMHCQAGEARTVLLATEKARAFGSGPDDHADLEGFCGGCCDQNRRRPQGRVALLLDDFLLSRS